MKTISYIVPIYNAQRYLAECIESILEQASDDIELILVDDGSSDESPRICDEYAQKDNRVTVIHQKNGGVSSARNSGLKTASGKYIRFVDSDDKICVNDEISIVKKSTADWITGGAFVLDGEERVLNEIRCAEKGVFDTAEILDKMDSRLKKLTLHYVWNHFYRRELIERGSLLFDMSVSLGEDFLFNIAYFRMCTRIEYIFTYICRYYKRGNASLTGVFKEDELARRRVMDRALVSLYEDMGMSEKKRSELNMMIGEIGYVSLMKIKHPIPRKSYKSRIEFVKQMFESEYSNYIMLYFSCDGCKVKSRGIKKLLIRLKLKRSFYWFLKLECWLASF